jgi:flagellar biosynthesis protein FlhA
VPALIISTAAGILVTRVANDDDFAQQLAKQIHKNQHALWVAAGVLGLLGVMPGMPHVSFIGFAALFGGLGWMLKSRALKSSSLQAANPLAPTPNPELGWEDVPVVEPLCLELPYRLIPLVDKGEESDLIKRIRAIRRKFINDVGFLTPSVHIRDNLQLPPETYRILIYGGEVGRGQCLPDRMLAIAPDGAAPMPGLQVKDPSFGMPATWIDRNARESAIASGHSVVEPAVVIATHLDTLIHRQAHELLGRQETQELLEHFKTSFPKLVEDVVPKVVSVALLQRLLRLLLEEGLPIKDLRTVIEVAAEHVPKIQDPLEILPHIRQGLRRTIVQKALGDSTRLRVLGVQPEFERLIEQAIGNAPVAADGSIEPSLMRLLVQEVGTHLDQMDAKGLPPVIVCGPRARLTLARIVKKIRPQAHVLAMTELPLEAELTFESMLCTQAAST